MKCLVLVVLALVAAAVATPVDLTNEGRITGGQLADLAQFPYQVFLRLYLVGGSASCGGTIISDRWVLTAAHCTDDLSTGVDVHVGAWDRTDKGETQQHIIFVQKSKVIIHEDWNPQTIQNDISLIKLPVPLSFNEYIQPAVLPKKADSYPTYVDQEVIASGWGRISDEAVGATDKLQWVQVPVMSNTRCSVYFLGSVRASNICIQTTGGLSTCNGDSGGPLVLADGSRTLVGATSFGSAAGCEMGYPGVFTRITSYLDWIEQQSGVVNNE